MNLPLRDVYKYMIWQRYWVNVVSTYENSLRMNLCREFLMPLSDFLRLRAKQLLVYKNPFTEAFKDKAINISEDLILSSLTNICHLSKLDSAANLSNLSVFPAQESPWFLTSLAPLYRHQDGNWIGGILADKACCSKSAFVSDLWKPYPSRPRLLFTSLTQILTVSQKVWS